jgi:uncharacterized membrane protein SpoIIM required for sporulation
VSTPASFDPQAFAAVRSERWRRLEQLLDHHERDPAGLGRAGLQDLLRLYRLAAADLNRARSRTASPALLVPLNALVARAYRALYAGGARRRPWRVGAFLLHDIPAAARARRGALAVALAAFLAGAALGFAAVLADPGAVERLVPAQFLAGSAAERVEDIEQGPERIDQLREAAGFASMLYTHNIQVTFLCAAAAATTVLGGLVLLLYNGVILGAVAAQYLLDGVGVFFLAWVGPHGALEIPGILIGSAAGLVLGRALWLPGGPGRAAALRAAAPDALRLLLAAALVLVAAGLIEGSFSQFTARTVAHPLKILVAAILFAGLVVWLFGFRLFRRSP